MEKLREVKSQEAAETAELMRQKKKILQEMQDLEEEREWMDRREIEKYVYLLYFEIVFLCVKSQSFLFVIKKRI